MVVTVTTAIRNAVTDYALANSLGLIAILLLLAMLIQKEVLGASADARARAFSQGLTIVLVPLLLAFGAAALARLSGILW